MAGGGTRTLRREGSSRLPRTQLDGGQRHPGRVGLIGADRTACSGSFPPRDRAGLRQPRQHPQIVSEHAPGDVLLTMAEALGAERATEELVLEDAHPALGLTPAFLQPPEFFIAQLFFEPLGRARTERVGDVFAG